MWKFKHTQPLNALAEWQNYFMFTGSIKVSNKLIHFIAAVILEMLSLKINTTVFQKQFPSWRSRLEAKIEATHQSRGKVQQRKHYLGRLLNEDYQFWPPDWEVTLHKQQSVELRINRVLDYNYPKCSHGGRVLRWKQTHPRVNTYGRMRSVPCVWRLREMIAAISQDRNRCLLQWQMSKTISQVWRVE